MDDAEKKLVREALRLPDWSQSYLEVHNERNFINIDTVCDHNGVLVSVDLTYEQAAQLRDELTRLIEANQPEKPFDGNTPLFSPIAGRRSWQKEQGET